MVERAKSKRNPYWMASYGPVVLERIGAREYTTSDRVYSIVMHPKEMENEVYCVSRPWFVIYNVGWTFPIRPNTGHRTMVDAEYALNTYLEGQYRMFRRDELIQRRKISGYKQSMIELSGRRWVNLDHVIFANDYPSSDELMLEFAMTTPDGVMIAATYRGDDRRQILVGMEFY